MRTKRKMTRKVAAWKARLAADPSIRLLDEAHWLAGDDQSQALNCLVKTEGERALPVLYLLARIDDRLAEICGTAVAQVAPTVIPELVEILTYADNNDDRRAGLVSMARVALGVLGEKAVAPLAEALRKAKKPYDKWEVALALVGAAPSDPAARRAVDEILSNRIVKRNGQEMGFWRDLVQTLPPKAAAAPLLVEAWLNGGQGTTFTHSVVRKEAIERIRDVAAGPGRLAVCLALQKVLSIESGLDVSRLKRLLRELKRELGPIEKLVLGSDS